MSFEDLSTAKYINLETFRKDDTGVKTPVWLAADNGNLYVWTDGDSWKAKRIRNNEQVKVCKSDARGNPQSDWSDATAQVLDTPADVEKLTKLMSTKYGLQFKFFTLMGKLRSSKTNRVSIEINLN